MNILDEFLHKLGVDAPEELSDAEQEVYKQWLEVLQSNQLTIERLHDMIHSVRSTIMEEIVKPDNSKNQDIYLKARLRNITLIDAFLMNPIRARKALEQTIRGMKDKRSDDGR